jgi:hypothetical protein
MSNTQFEVTQHPIHPLAWIEMNCPDINPSQPSSEGIPPQSPPPRPKGDAVVKALLAIEKEAKKTRQRYLTESLIGDWQLYFSTSGKVRPSDRQRSGFYWPKLFPAQISFHSSAEEGASDSAPLSIHNQIRLGQLELTLSGAARYLEQKSLLAFDFTQIQLRLFGKTLYHGKFPGRTSATPFSEIPINKLAFFSFFCIRDRWIAARGRGGGLAIWVKKF